MRESPLICTNKYLKSNATRSAKYKLPWFKWTFLLSSCDILEVVLMIHDGQKM